MTKSGSISQMSVDLLKGRSAAAFGPAEGDQIPRALRSRCLPAQDVKISVIGLNFIEDSVGFVPAVGQSRHLMVSTSQPKPYRPLVQRAPAVVLTSNFIGHSRPIFGASSPSTIGGLTQPRGASSTGNSDSARSVRRVMMIVH